MQVSSKRTSDGKTGARGPRQVCVSVPGCLMMDLGCHVVYFGNFQQQHIFSSFSAQAKLRVFAGDGIRDTSKNKTPGHFQKEYLRLRCVGMRDRSAAQPRKYPRLPIRGALKRYGSSKLHMRPALLCTRRRGRGGPVPREIWMSGRLYTCVLRYVRIY